MEIIRQHEQILRQVNLLCLGVDLLASAKDCKRRHGVLSPMGKALRSSLDIVAVWRVEDLADNEELFVHVEAQLCWKVQEPEALGLLADVGAAG